MSVCAPLDWVLVCICVKRWVAIRDQGRDGDCAMEHGVWVPNLCERLLARRSEPADYFIELRGLVELCCLCLSYALITKSISTLGFAA